MISIMLLNYGFTATFVAAAALESDLPESIDEPPRHDGGARFTSSSVSSFPLTLSFFKSAFGVLRPCNLTTLPISRKTFLYLLWLSALCSMKAARADIAHETRSGCRCTTGKR